MDQPHTSSPPPHPAPDGLLPPPPLAASTTTRHWIHHPAFLVASVVLCFPIGLLLVWTSPWSLRAKSIATGLTALLVAVSVVTSPPEQPATLAASSPPASEVADVRSAPERQAMTTPSTTTTTAATTTTEAPTTTAPPTTTIPAMTAPPTTAATTAPTKAAPATTKAAVKTPAAPPTTAAPAGGCHASYTPCVPIATDVDCLGNGGDGPEYVSGPIRVIGPDKYRLDGNNDGIGCE